MRLSALAIGLGALLLGGSPAAGRGGTRAARTAPRPNPPGPAQEEDGPLLWVDNDVARTSLYMFSNTQTVEAAGLVMQLMGTQVYRWQIAKRVERDGPPDRCNALGTGTAAMLLMLNGPGQMFAGPTKLRDAIQDCCQDLSKRMRLATVKADLAKVFTKGKKKEKDLGRVADLMKGAFTDPQVAKVLSRLENDLDALADSEPFKRLCDTAEDFNVAILDYASSPRSASKPPGPPPGAPARPPTAWIPSMLHRA